jgi:outer membrane biosynthesis protein TonB
MPLLPVLVGVVLLGFLIGAGFALLQRQHDDLGADTVAAPSAALVITPSPSPSPTPVKTTPYPAVVPTIVHTPTPPEPTPTAQPPTPSPSPPPTPTPTPTPSVSFTAGGGALSGTDGGADDRNRSGFRICR